MAEDERSAKQFIAEVRSIAEAMAISRTHPGQVSDSVRYRVKDFLHCFPFATWFAKGREYKTKPGTAVSDGKPATTPVIQTFGDDCGVIDDTSVEICKAISDHLTAAIWQQMVDCETTSQYRDWTPEIAEAAIQKAAKELPALCDQLERKLGNAPSMAVASPFDSGCDQNKEIGISSLEAPEGDAVDWRQTFIELCEEILARLDAYDPEQFWGNWWDEVWKLTHELEDAKTQLPFNQSSPAILIFEFQPTKKPCKHIVRWCQPQWETCLKNQTPEFAGMRATDPATGVELSAVIGRKGGKLINAVTPAGKVYSTVWQGTPLMFDKARESVRKWLRAAKRLRDRTNRKLRTGLGSGTSGKSLTRNGREPAEESLIIYLARAVSGLKGDRNEVFEWLDGWWIDRKYQKTVAITDAEAHIITQALQAELDGNGYKIRRFRLDSGKVDIRGFVDGMGRGKAKELSNAEAEGLRAYLNCRMLGKGDVSFDNLSALWLDWIERSQVRDKPIDSDEFRASKLGLIPPTMLDEITERAGIDILSARSLPLISLIRKAAHAVNLLSAQDVAEGTYRSKVTEIAQNEHSGQNCSGFDKDAASDVKVDSSPVYSLAGIIEYMQRNETGHKPDNYPNEITGHFKYPDDRDAPLMPLDRHQLRLTADYIESQRDFLDAITEQLNRLDFRWCPARVGTRITSEMLEHIPEILFQQLQISRDDSLSAKLDRVHDWLSQLKGERPVPDKRLSNIEFFNSQIEIGNELNRMLPQGLEAAITKRRPEEDPNRPTWLPKEEIQEEYKSGGQWYVSAMFKHKFDLQERDLTNAAGSRKSGSWGVRIRRFKNTELDRFVYHAGDIEKLVEARNRYRDGQVPV